MGYLDEGGEGGRNETVKGLASIINIIHIIRKSAKGPGAAAYGGEE